MIKYNVSDRVNINFEASFIKSTYIENFIPEAPAGDFEPIDSRHYSYNQPEAYVTYKIGLGYSF